MHSPGSADIERKDTILPECVEFFDVTPSGKSARSPSVKLSQLESPGAVCRQTSSDEFHNMVALFTKKVGYEPHLTGVNARSRSELMTIMQRGIWHSKLEKWMNIVVMFVIVLDTLLVVFEFDNEDESQPVWIIFLNWVFLLVYTLEVAFRLHIANPTSAFFRKRFYVLDLMIVVVCVALQIASSMSAFASAIRAIRLFRMIRLVKLFKFLRVFTRVLEMWHEYNKRKVKVDEGTSLHINLRMKVDNFKLQELLARKKVKGSVKLLENGRAELSGDQRELDIQELFKIVKVLKEEDDKGLFTCTEFSMEWLMLLTLWLGVVLVLSWLFLILEFDNYQMIIEKNLELKSLVDNSLPVRDQLPDILTSLAGCQDNTTMHSYISLNKVYEEYTGSNKTLWNDLNSFMGSYAFTNPWTFAGSSFFTISVVTTIGYGSFTPSTTSGQLVVIFTSLPAIYITIIFGRKNIQMFKAGLCKTQYESVGMIVFFSVFILVVFMLVGGHIISKHEGWTLWESVYFCWVSSSTIGFGDYAPTVGEQLNITYLALVIVGWHVVAFVISVMEVTLSAMKQMDWWSEHYLFPPGTNIKSLPKRSSVKQTHSDKFYGVAKVVKESIELPKLVMEASLLLTPTRQKRSFKRHNWD